MICMTLGVRIILLEMQWNHGLYGTFTLIFAPSLTMIFCRWGKNFLCSKTCPVLCWRRKIHSTFSSVIVTCMSVVVFHAVIFFESQTKLKITWSKFSIGKSMLLTLVMILNLVGKSWMHGHCNSVMREMVFSLPIHCCQDVWHHHLGEDKKFYKNNELHY